MARQPGNLDSGILMRNPWVMTLFAEYPTRTRWDELFTAPAPGPVMIRGAGENPPGEPLP
jgi:hypothetical protein